jgi:cephalosporin hydroxylase
VSDTPGGERTLYLHVGMGRCGTSAIQRFGETHRSALLERGVLYPSALEMGFTAEEARGGNGRGFAATDDPDAAIARIAEHLDGSDADRFLISAEQLLGPKDGRLARLAEGLHARGIRTIAVFYVREQREWLVSRWAQGLKSQGWATTLDDYIAGRLQRARETAILTYGVRCAQIASVFGRENLIVRRFQRDALEGGDARIDVFSLAGVDVSDLVSDTRENTSASLEESVMVRLVNALPESAAFDSRAFLRYLDSQPADERNGGVQAPLYALAAPETMRAAAQYFGPVNEDFRREFLPEVPAPVFTSAIPDDYEQITEDEATTSRAITMVGNYMARRTARVLRGLDPAEPGVLDEKTAALAPTRFDHRLTQPLYEYYEQLQEQIMHATHWMGVPMRKNPLDSWVYQEILHAVRPDVIVEIGSYVGGSTLFFANLMDLLGHGEVISVEVRRDRYEAEHPRISEVTGESLDPEVIAEVRRRCEGRRAIVIHDGDHRREVVLGELRAYAELVPVGSYYIVEDGSVDQFPLGSPLHPKKFAEGPLLGVEDFLREDDRFEVDRSMERYLITWNPSGYLRRVR